MKEAASKDDSCMSICDAIENGFVQKKSEAAECLRPYYKLIDELYSLDGVPFLGGRMYIPKSLRRETLTILHSAHQGPAGMIVWLTFTRQLVYCGTRIVPQTYIIDVCGSYEEIVIRQSARSSTKRSVGQG